MFSHPIIAHQSLLPFSFSSAARKETKILFRTLSFECIVSLLRFFSEVNLLTTSGYQDRKGRTPSFTSSARFTLFKTCRVAT